MDTVSGDGHQDMLPTPQDLRAEEIVFVLLRIRHGERLRFAAYGRHSRQHSVVRKQNVVVRSPVLGRGTSDRFHFSEYLSRTASNGDFDDSAALMRGAEINIADPLAVGGEAN